MYFLKIIYKVLIDRLLGGYSFNVRTVKAPNTGAQRRAEVLLFDFGESFVVSDDFVALAVQLAAEDQVVERVREQVLAEQDPHDLTFADVFPVIIFAALCNWITFNSF